MARLNVNPTRMELSKLKKKLESARRGHKLLKDKRDELMRQFMNLIRENRELRAEVESAIADANRYMAVAGSVMQGEILETALNLGYADDIEELVKPSLYRNRHDEVLQVYLGWAHLTRGEAQKAAKCFETAGKINPGSELVLYALKYKETMMES